jgi:hypothetical protein
MPPKKLGLIVCINKYAISLFYFTHSLGIWRVLRWLRKSNSVCRKPAAYLVSFLVREFIDQVGLTGQTDRITPTSSFSSHTSLFFFKTSSFCLCILSIWLRLAIYVYW